MDITVKNLQISISIPYSKIKTVALKTGQSLGLSKRYGEISIVFVGVQRMHKINKTYLGHDYATDVITFDLKENAEILICPQVARQNAKIYGVSVTKEIMLYLVHGLLHLAGYDDRNPQDIQRMRSKEKTLLDQWI